MPRKTYVQYGANAVNIEPFLLANDLFKTETYADIFKMNQFQESQDPFLRFDLFVVDLLRGHLLWLQLLLSFFADAEPAQLWEGRRLGYEGGGGKEALMGGNGCRRGRRASPRLPLQQQEAANICVRTRESRQSSIIITEAKCDDSFRHWNNTVWNITGAKKRFRKSLFYNILYICLQKIN